MKPLSIKQLSSIKSEREATSRSDDWGRRRVGGDGLWTGVEGRDAWLIVVGLIFFSFLNFNFLGTSFGLSKEVHFKFLRRFNIKISTCIVKKIYSKSGQMTHLWAPYIRHCTYMTKFAILDSMNMKQWQVYTTQTICRQISRLSSQQISSMPSVPNPNHSPVKSIQILSISR